VSTRPEDKPIRPLYAEYLGLADYVETLERMRRYTDERDADSPDKLWLLEHPPIFTQGQAGKAEHLLAPGDIPVVKTDRGGQVTYHGPGQLVAYPMLSLKRLGLNVRGMVSVLEDSVVALLKAYDIDAAARPDAPGVYVDAKKVASLGLRIRRACTFHGVAININIDLTPFKRINPCGYADLEMTRLSDLYQGAQTLALPEIAVQYAHILASQLDMQLELAALPAPELTARNP